MNNYITIKIYFIVLYRILAIFVNFKYITLLTNSMLIIKINKDFFLHRNSVLPLYILSTN